MWYAVYRQDTGALLSIGTVLGEGLPNAELGVVPYEVQPDLDVVMWDAAQRMFVARPPAPPQRVISKRRFMGRLSVQEQATLNAIRLNPSTPLEVRAQLETARELRDMVTEINLDDPAVALFAPFAIDLLVGAGVIPAVDREARIAAWLADPED